MRALPSQAFGSLETAVLEILCAADRPLTIREMHAALAGRDLAYTTIMTTAIRMVEKGMLSREQTAARYAAAYRSMVPR